MPESGTFGSVRGVPGNRHSYRDPPGVLRTHLSGLSQAQPGVCVGVMSCPRAGCGKSACPVR